MGFIVACGGGNTDPGDGLSSGDPTAVTCSGADVSKLPSPVLVSTQGTDDAGCGTTPTQTCLTIQKGIARCAQTGCGGVLVRHGLYTTTRSTIGLVNGVSVYGGCRFGDEPDRGYRTTIQASPDIGEPAIDASGIVTSTRIHGLVVVAADRGVGEGASIAMRATSSPGLTLTRTVLASGRGGDGNSGATGSAGAGGTGGSGDSGAGGGLACSAAPPPASRGQGGHGGDGLMGFVDNSTCRFGSCSCGYRNPTQSIGQPGLPSGSIVGGAGGHRNSLGGYVCTYPASADRFRGDDGGSGNPGACATQGGSTSADLWGSVTAQGWQASAGGGGAAGDVGSGGGGGTSGGFCLIYNPLGFVQGVAAGGGGGGGCGGGGGAGGQQGGASIALLLVASSAALEPQGVVLSPGPGGNGGVGGTGVAGGQGGPGGAGGAWGGTNVDGYLCPGQSGTGGLGGTGGTGAGGAGGNGGPSINIAMAASAAQPKGADDAYGGTPGLGGNVGKGLNTQPCTTPDGAGGVGGGAATVINFDKPPSNVLSVGQTLRAATNDSRYSPSGRYRMTMQDDGNLCLYDSGVYRWCSIQDEKWLQSAYLVMQPDGNLCLYDQNGLNPSCSETTLGHRGAYLSVEDDGHIVVREGSLVLWSRPKVPS